MHPKYKVDKTYIVQISRPLEERHKIKLMKGIKIEGIRTGPCEIAFPKRNTAEYHTQSRRDGAETYHNVSERRGQFKACQVKCQPNDNGNNRRREPILKIHPNTFPFPILRQGLRGC